MKLILNFLQSYTIYDFVRAVNFGPNKHHNYVIKTFGPSVMLRRLLVSKRFFKSKDLFN